MDFRALAGMLWTSVDGRQKLRYVPAEADRTQEVEGIVLRPRSRRNVTTTADGSLPQDVLVHMPAGEDFTPRPGDRLETADGRRWTILAAELVAAGSRWELYARDLVLAHRLDRHVTVEVLFVDKHPDGTARRKWRVWKTGVRAHVSLWQARVEGAARRSYERRYRVVLEECPPVDRYIRLRTPAGKVLEVLSVHRAERVDHLPWVEAVEVLDS